MEESRGIFGSVNVDAATADNVIKQNLAALGENVAVSTHTAPHAFTVTHPLYVPCRLLRFISRQAEFNQITKEHAVAEKLIVLDGLLSEQPVSSTRQERRR
jgi:hypothetical protein